MIPHRKNSVGTARIEAGRALWPSLFRVWLEGSDRWRIEQAGSGREKAEMPGGIFPDLSTALEYARMMSGGAETTLELYIGPVYAVVHQDRGWTRPICAGGLG